MRILIDTNIIIHREDPKEISEELQKLLKIFNEEKYSLIVHPASIYDIKKDKDLDRQKITLSKLRTYVILENPPNYLNDSDFISKIPNYSNLNEHDIIDLQIFYALYKNAISYLITQDKKIYKWAQIFEIESCYNVLDALELFQNLITASEKVFKPIPIKYLPLHNLDLTDNFFDNLREDYGNNKFNDWFKKKSSEGEEAYVYINENGSLGAFLMLKEENEYINSKPNVISAKKRLKISTLKVSNYGNKIGELFLNLSFNYALKNNFDEIYLTHFLKENDRLIYLIEKYGFIKSPNYIEHNHTKEKEFIYLKQLKPSKLLVDNALNYDEIRNVYFPSFYDGNKNKKFLIPIKPVWHDRLFPELRRQSYLQEFTGEFIVEGNTIQKAYLSHSNSRLMNQGDVIIFYQSENDQRVTTIGTIDKIHYNISDSEIVAKLVGKRTVYSLDEINNMISSKPLTVILFKYHFPLPNQIKFKELKDKQIIISAPQSISELKQYKYLELKKQAKINIHLTTED